MAGEPERRSFVPSRIPPRRKPGERRRNQAASPGYAFDLHGELLRSIREREVDDPTDNTPPTAIPSAYLITLAPEDEDQDQEEVPTIQLDRRAIQEAERRRRLAPPPAPAQRAWVDVSTRAPLGPTQPAFSMRELGLLTSAAAVVVLVALLALT